MAKKIRKIKTPHPNLGLSKAEFVEMQREKKDKELKLRNLAAEIDAENASKKVRKEAPKVEAPKVEPKKKGGRPKRIE